MEKRSIYKAVSRELIPYVLYVVTVFLLANGGLFYALYTFELEGRERSVPEDYAAALYLLAFAVNLLIFAAGAALIVRQLFRYLLPLKNVICHIDEMDGTKEGSKGRKNVYYQNVDGKVIRFLEDYKVCRLQLEQAETLVQTDFIDKLLNAGFKSKNQLLAEAENIRFPVYGFRYRLIVAEIFGNVTDEDVDVDTIYESGVILDYLRQAVEGEGGYRNAWFRKVSYRRMSIVMQLHDRPAAQESLMEEFSADERCGEGRQESEGRDDSLEKRLMELRADFKQKYGVNVSWGVSRICRDPLYLWKCRDEANVAAACCDGGRGLVVYSPELESSVKCYLPGVARNNLFSYIESGNTDETRKLIAFLKQENCGRRNLSRGQLVALNGKVVRMLEKFKESEGAFAEEMADLLNGFVLQDEGSREEYFDLLEDCCVRLCERYGEEKKDRKNRLAREIKAYIDKNYRDKDLSLTQIGAAFNISDSYVSLIFKDFFGVKFSSYLEEVRISRADRLLEESGMTIREIAEQTGYASEQSFRRAFKHARGISPKDARGGMTGSV